ncbi:MAG: NAD(+) diphosphatase [Candidatus Nanopelagicales bacterium]|nr:NAD(+) diphosphatase [Candidatus Nanopelagicales bacterium]
MTNTHLFDDLLFTRAGLDRATHLRTDDEFLATLLTAQSKAIWVHRGESPLDVDSNDHELAVIDGEHVAAFIDGDHSRISFLGLDASGNAFIAVHLNEREELSGEQLWVGLREARNLPDLHASAFVTAVGLDNWRNKHQRCAVCGDELVVTQAGWTLHCAAHEMDHFPRTDPAIIVLVRDADDRAMLGRQASWPEGQMSTIAGFVEPGESAEDAVRREVFEETGVIIGKSNEALTYCGSQPWPFPASLMLGYQALAERNEINVDQHEIAEARWFTRDEMRTACESGELKLPPTTSISRQLIERWFGEPLPGNWSR